MDANNNNTNDGFLHHIFDPHHVGQTLTNIVRGILPQHPQPSLTATSSSQDVQYTGVPLPVSPSSGLRPGTIDVDLPPVSELISLDPSNLSSPYVNASLAATSTVSSLSTTMPFPPPSNSDEGMHDVDMAPAHDSDIATSSSRNNSSVPARNSRRARVDDSDDEDLRQSNRQRLHSHSTLDDLHHFMPIPDDHGPPPQTTAGHGAHSPVNPEQDHPPHGPAPPPQLSRMMMSIDFIPLTLAYRQPGQPRGSEGDNPNAQQDNNHPDDDGQPPLNFFVNFPIPGHGPAPPTGEAPNINNAGNTAAMGGFMFPPFPFPFGMDMLEERDDPARAKRLLNGLEEVPFGLVKRMERVGGPGTARGEVPTCSVCWESLLEPEGGGFEGNAELAEAEAAEAASDDTTSQPPYESSVDSNGPVSSSSSETSPAKDLSSSTTTPVPGQNKHPKIVVLPCSHTFHATCLQPWFSKPGRTTCPSCRFDIDPDSLTYRPRPLRRRRRAAAGDGPAVPPQFPPQFPLQFMTAPLSTGDTQPQATAVPLPATQVPPSAPVDGPASANTEPQTVPPSDQHGQQRQPLPPFVTFDISMIIPIFPGRAPGAAPTSNGTAESAIPIPTNPQGPALPPPRTDNNGFRLDDTLLQEAVRTTFERLFGRPAPPIIPQQQPPSADGDAAPSENGRILDQQWFTFTGPMPAGFPPMPPLNAHGAPPPGTPRHQSNPRRPVEKRPWAPPPAPGPTLRQVVERNEREMGLRCSDVCCGLGPSDEDPMSSADVSTLEQIAIHPLKSGNTGKETVCEHEFHPACLVSAGRIAGWGHEVAAGEGDSAGEGENVEVSCPVCRALGAVCRSGWDEGVRALA